MELEEGAAVGLQRLSFEGSEQGADVLCQTESARQPVSINEAALGGFAHTTTVDFEQKSRPDGPDDLTCPICLEQVDPVDMATIKGCEHLYCVHCILQWSLCKDEARCPQCKSPFTYVYCHRLLDGTVVDFPVEETITLLKRAKWFEQGLKETENGEALWREAERRGGLMDANSGGGDWQNEFFEDFEDERDEDEEIEQFYFSAAAGRARVFGNRRLGENGFLRAGRQYARPLPQPVTPPPAPAGKSKGRSNGLARGAGSASSSATPDGSCGSSSAAAAGCTGTASSSCGGASKPPVNKAGKTNVMKGVTAAKQCGLSGGKGVDCDAPVDEAGSSAGKVVGRRASRKARRMAANGDDDWDEDF